MASHTAVGVDDDLSAGQAAVALRAADDKAAGGVDVDFRFGAHQFLWNDGVDDLALDVGAKLLHRHIRGVLVGNNDGFHRDRPVVLILDGDLGLAVRTQVRKGAVLAHLGQALCQLVRQRDGHRHQLRGVVAGKAEHHALVARTVVLLGDAGFLGFQRAVNTQRDVAGLLVDRGDDAAGVAVKAKFCAVVADVADNLARDFGDVDIALGADLTHHQHHAGGDGGLTGYAAVRILLEDCVEHCVGDLVADLVGMSFGDRFGGKQIFCHFLFRSFLFCNVDMVVNQTARSLFEIVPFFKAGIKKGPDREIESCFPHLSALPQDLAPYKALRFLQVAGLHRACPLCHS